MGTRKMFLKIFATSFAHEVNRDARSIGSNQRSGRSMFFNLFVYFLFNFEVLDNDFYSPINIFYFGHVVCEIAQLNTRSELLIKE